MKQTKLKSISKAADPDSTIARLQTKALELRRLDRVFRSCLPKSLADHVSLATIRNGLLVACADSPMWATNIRYDTPRILIKLAQTNDFPEVHDIKLIHSRTSLSLRNNRKHERPNVLSEQTKDLLSQQASVVKNRKLKNSLNKLAKNIQ